MDEQRFRVRRDARTLGVADAEAPWEGTLDELLPVVGGVVFVAEPIAALDGNGVASQRDRVELLARLWGPGGSPYLPGSVIAAAERAGVIARIDNPALVVA